MRSRFSSLSSRRLFLTAFACAALAVASSASAQSCAPADSQSTYYVELIQSIATATRSEDVVERTQLGIPAVAATQVTFVSDERTCGKALTAYNAALPATYTGPRATAVYVIKAGTTTFAVIAPHTYPALGPSEILSTSTSVMIFDSKWVKKSAFAG